MKAGDFFSSLTSHKSFGYILLALIAGVVLLVWPSGAGTSKPDPVELAPDSSQYVRELEGRTQELICRLEGVKSCSVMLTLDSSYSYLYASDQHVNQTSGSTDSEKQIVLRTVDGDEYPIVISEYLPEIRAAAVVCRGGDKSTVADIKYMLSALFGISESGIFVTCGE